MNPVATCSVICPRCRGRTRDEIRIHAGAQHYVHLRQRGHANCQLVVIPDPAGQDHWVREVPGSRNPIEFLRTLILEDPAVRARHTASLIKGIEAVA